MKAKLKSQAGNVSAMGIIGGLVLVIAYLVYPDLFHDFFRWLTNTLFNLVDSNFGDSKPAGNANEAVERAKEAGDQAKNSK